MPNTDPQTEFLEKFLPGVAAKMIALRKARDKELKSVKPTQTIDKSALEAMLVKTGRAAATSEGDTAQAQEERKENFLQNILQMDEEGSNAQMIATYFSDVTEIDFKTAREVITPDTPAKQQTAIREAQAKVQKRQAHEEYVQNQIMAENAELLKAKIQATGQTEDQILPKDMDALRHSAKQEALAKVAKAEYQALEDEFTQKILAMDDSVSDLEKLSGAFNTVTPDEIESAKIKIKATDKKNLKQKVAQAKKSVADQKAHHDFLAQRLNDENAAILQAKIVATGQAEADIPTAEMDVLVAGAKKEALAKVAAVEFSQRSGRREVPLSHDVSRHGPQTTLDEQVTRVATGFPPDMPDIAAGPATSHQPNVGEAVNIPASTSMGPKPADVSARMTSAETSLHHIEDALGQAHQAQAAGALEPGNTITLKTGPTTTNPLTGETRVSDKTGDTALTEFDDSQVDAHGKVIKTAIKPGSKDATHPQGIPLPDVSLLNDDATDKAALIAERAAATKIDPDVRGMRVATKITKDGGFRAITSFPDKDQLTRELEKNDQPFDLDHALDKVLDNRIKAATMNSKISIGKKKGADKKLAAASKRVESATEALSDAEADTDGDEDVAVLFKSLSEAAKVWADHQAASEALAELGPGLTSQLAKLGQASASIDQEVHDSEMALAPIQKAYDADKSDANKEALRNAEAELQRKKELKAEIERRIATATRERDKVTANRVKAQQDAAASLAAVNTAHGLAAAKSSPEKADAIKNGALALSKATVVQTDAAAFAAEIGHQVKAMNQALADLNQAKTERKAAATAPTDEKIDEELNTRKAALVDAIATGTLQDEIDKWDKDIQAVQQILNEDEKYRKEVTKDKKETVDRLQSAQETLGKEIVAAQVAVSLMQEEGDPAAVEDEKKRLEIFVAKKREVDRALPRAQVDLSRSEDSNKLQGVLERTNMLRATERLKSTVAQAKVDAAQDDDAAKPQLERELQVQMARETVTACINEVARLDSERFDLQRVFDIAEARCVGHEQRQDPLDSLRKKVTQAEDALNGDEKLAPELATLRDSVIPIWERDIARKASSETDLTQCIAAQKAAVEARQAAIEALKQLN